VIEMTYNHNGIRTGKRVTAPDGIVGEVRRDGNGVVTDRLEFIYDESGRPIQLIHNRRIYNYVLNLQGDV